MIAKFTSLSGLVAEIGAMALTLIVDEVLARIVVQTKPFTIVFGPSRSSLCLHPRVLLFISPPLTALPFFRDRDFVQGRS
jgi:hypothetical protein